MAAIPGHCRVLLATGRLVIIEVKLAGNAESRRAVVAQVFLYLI